jgi:hypothetical protein
MEVEEFCYFFPICCFTAFLSLPWFLDGPVLFLLASSSVFRFAIRRLAGFNI